MLLAALCTLLLLALPVPASPAPLGLAPGGPALDASFHALYYDESAADANAADVLANPGLFQTRRNHAHHPGAATHWIRLPLKNTARMPGRWVLNLGVPDLELLQVYLAENGKQPVLVVDLRAHAPFAARPLPERLLGVPIDLKASEEAGLYLRYRAHADTPLRLELLSPDDFRKRLAEGNLINGALLGLLLALALFAVLHYLAAEQIAYLAYAAMALSMIGFLMQFEGYNFEYLWPGLGSWNQDAPMFLLAAIQASHALFAMALFDLRRRFSRLYRLFLAYLTLLPPVVGAFLWLGWAWPGLLAGLAYVPLVVGAGIHLLRQGQPVAGLFLAGALANTLFTTVLFGLAIFGVGLGVSPFVYPKIGYVGEALFFAVALARQTQELRRQVENGLRLRLAETEQLARVEADKHRALLAAQQRQLQLAAAGHDLSQPLSSIRFALAALGPQAGNEAATRHIGQALDYTESLLRGLIDEARRDYAARRAALELEDLFAAVCSRHAEAARRKGLELRCRPTALRVEGSELLLGRILDNLVGNAIRYTGRGAVLVGVRRRGKELEIQVLDTGPGFDAAQGRRLLAPFEQGASPTPERLGHGLGLHIVRALCEQAGYRLTVCSKPGRGSTFGIRLPATA